ncbi:MAG: efflux RND transporter permease subunit, partial [Candidatus Hydrogenedentes bacterium]|nr:efflux RND transporter permease subunit [Candidatus Hydrogenedentota bacterium]
MKNFIRLFVRNRVFANVLLLIIVVVGVLASHEMIREFFPETQVDIVNVVVPFPGADPEEVEEGISRKIEDAIENVEGIKRYHTYSSENVGRAVIEVADGADMSEVTDRVRNAIDTISTFPVDAEKPIISEVTYRQIVLFLALWGDMTERQLKEQAEQIKDDLQRDPNISQIFVSGVRDYEIAIEVSEEKLREYGLTFDEVSRTVRRESLNLSAGMIRTKGEEIRIRTVGRKYTGKDYASIVVRSSPEGNITTLNQLATIHDEFTEDPVFAMFNGKPCALLTLYKTSDEDALAISDTVKKFVARENQQLPKGVHISTFFDMTKMIRARINLLTRNGMFGLALVFLLLWLFLEFRLSFWVAMGIPISLSGALAIMWAMGGSINMLSLFALIMVLGIIVDDAIVVGEAIYVHRKRGEGPVDAAVAGVMEVGMPVIASVTTTIVAFLPLGFSAGIMGKFIKIIPVGVISALAISLLECLFLLPAYRIHLPDLNAPAPAGHPISRLAKRMRHNISNGMEWFVEHVYVPFVARAVRWRYVTLSIAIAIMLTTAGMVSGGFIKYVTFPKVDGDIIISNIEFPDGTPIEVTRAAVDRTRDALEKTASKFTSVTGEPIIKNVYTTAGSMANDIESTVSSNVGQVMAELLPTERRGIHFEDINVAWQKEIGAIPGVISQTFSGISPGPPGADIEIYLQ